jgi:small subunit ribosomal protein S16
MPRDGRFIERLGTYNPLLARDREDRVQLNEERIRFWMERGAKPTDRVAKFLGQADVIPMPKRNNPDKAKPKAKAQERLQAAKDAAEAAAAAEAEAAAAPAEEAPEAEAAGEAES